MRSTSERRDAIRAAIYATLRSAGPVDSRHQRGSYVDALLERPEVAEIVDARNATERNTLSQVTRTLVAQRQLRGIYRPGSKSIVGVRLPNQEVDDDDDRLTPTAPTSMPGVGRSLADLANLGRAIVNHVKEVERERDAALVEVDRLRRAVAEYEQAFNDLTAPNESVGDLLRSLGIEPVWTEGDR